MKYKKPKKFNHRKYYLDPKKNLGLMENIKTYKKIYCNDSFKLNTAIIYLLIYPKICSIISKSFSISKAIAEEHVQDAFVKLMDNYHDLINSIIFDFNKMDFVIDNNFEELVKKFLKIAKNSKIDFYRYDKKFTSQEPETLDYISYHNNYAEYNDNIDFNRDAKIAIFKSNLNDLEKLIFKLKYEKKFSYDEITKILNISRNEIRSILNRRKVLMRKLYFSIKILQYLHASKKKDVIFKLNEFIKEYRKADNNYRKILTNLNIIPKNVYELLNHACYISNLLPIGSLEKKFNLKRAALQKIVRRAENVFTLKYYQLFKELFDIMSEELLIVEAILIQKYPELRSLKKFNYPKIENKALKLYYLYDLVISQFE